MELNKLENALKVLEDSFGIDACLAAANEVYSSVYKSAESFTLADMIAANGEEYASTIRRDFRELVAEYLAIGAGTFVPPTQEEIQECYDLDYDLDVDRTPVEDMYSLADQLLDNGIRFVNLCNYKGEDAGYMLEELAGSLKVYVSKYNYI